MPKPTTDRTDRVFPLDSGDRLTRAEFERRYSALPGLKKAELIEGVVYMPSPARHRSHGKPHSRIVAWLVMYAAQTSGVDCSDNGTVRMDLDNEPQPDALLMIAGGRCHVDEDDYLEGAPELIAEIAASTASYDLGAKKNAYRRNGVQEYIVWRALDEEIDWFILEEGSYRLLEESGDGILRSKVFPGLWLDAKALMEDRMDRVLAVLERGIASPDHQSFSRRSNPSGQV